MRAPTFLTSCALAVSASLYAQAIPVNAQVSQTSPEIAGPSHLDRSKLVRDIEAILETHQVSGGYVAVTMGPGIVFSRSFGTDPSTGASFGADTTVRLASASKLLTALTIASLVQKGAISLDQTLGEIDPETPPAWRSIPLWRILNHTSGLPMVVSRDDFNALDGDEMAKLEMTDLLEMIGDEKLDFEPGTQWRYQQSGYAVLASAIGKRSGVPWLEIVDRELVRAAGLNQTGFGNDADVFEFKDGKQSPHLFTYPELFSSAGGLQTTGNDALRLLLALAGGKILNEDSLRSLVNDTRWLERLGNDVAGEGYGSGFAVQRFGDLAFFGHSGGGGLADIRYAPESQIGIAVLTNRAGGTGAAIEVADMIAERLCGPAHAMAQ